MADPLMATSTMARAAQEPDVYIRVNVKELYRFLLQPFPREECLKDYKNRTLLSPIFNHAESIQDQRDRDSRIGQYTSTKKFVIDYIRSLEKAKYTKAQLATCV